MPVRLRTVPARKDPSKRFPTRGVQYDACSGQSRISSRAAPHPMKKIALASKPNLNRAKEFCLKAGHRHRYWSCKLCHSHPSVPLRSKVVMVSDWNTLRTEDSGFLCSMSSCLAYPWPPHAHPHMSLLLEAHCSAIIFLFDGYPRCVRTSSPQAIENHEWPGCRRA
jgi:hypothetical protein